ncbi:VTT domain-containing protein [Paracidobacterium acidisoli]|uniref:VTT domain-containing protein n=1 Tax=Paracidobacterium acidisoli TaxID=2303751 RepID=UPI001313EA85|nr:VTT domain-containing protein [Paracidobacterium acidisoli]
MSLVLEFAARRRSFIPGWLLHLGFSGVFLVAVIDSCPIPTPIPGSTDILVLLLSAHHALPWLTALAAVAGSLCGGWFTWSAGKKGGQAMLDRFASKRFRRRIERWVKEHALLSVACAALLPPPVPLLPFLLAAGALGVSRRQMFLALGMARSLRYGLEALLGYLYGRRILHWWNHSLSGWSTAILWTFLGLVVAGILFGIWRYRLEQRREKDTKPIAKSSPTPAAR